MVLNGVLGVDPGSRITGYAVIACQSDGMVYCQAAGIIRLREKDMGVRCGQLFRALSALMGQYHVSHVALEAGFVHKNPSIALKLGQIRGVILAAAGSRNIPCAEYTPRAIKKAVVGYGAAEKQQVQWVTQRLFDLPEQPLPDTADALAVAWYHVQLLRTQHAEFRL